MQSGAHPLRFPFQLPQHLTLNAGHARAMLRPSMNGSPRGGEPCWPVITFKFQTPPAYPRAPLSCTTHTPARCTRSNSLMEPELRQPITAPDGAPLTPIIGGSLQPACTPSILLYSERLRVNGSAKLRMHCGVVIILAEP